MLSENVIRLVTWLLHDLRSAKTATILMRFIWQAEFNLSNDNVL